MFLQGVKYNIPVQIWLPEGYARQPPIMYVVPTSTMIIKPGHSFVDASGVVSSPYVRNWIPGRYRHTLFLCRPFSSVCISLINSTYSGV